MAGGMQLLPAEKEEVRKKEVVMELSICWTGCGIVIGFRKEAASAVAVTGKQASLENESREGWKKTDGDASKVIHVKTEWRGKENDPVEVLQRAENGQPESLLKRSTHEWADGHRAIRRNEAGGVKDDEIDACPASGREKHAGKTGIAPCLPDGQGLGDCPCPEDGPRQANGNNKKNDPFPGYGQGPGGVVFSGGGHCSGGDEYFGTESGTSDGPDLRRGDLSEGDLSRGDLSEGDLSEGDFSRGGLSRSDFSGDDPSGGQPEEAFGEATFRKEAAYFFHLTQSAVSEIKPGIRAAAEKKLGRAELLRSLRRLLRRYMELTASRALAFRVAINNVILSEAATYCSIHLEIQELQLLWGRKR